MNGTAATRQLVVQGICKAFAAPVLADVDIAVLAGSIHGLVGENGAGKTTLAKILVGLESADAGSLLLNGRPYRPRHAADSRAVGVALCTQELSLFDDLSIAENILLHESPSAFARIRRRRAAARARELLALVGLDADPGMPVGRLGLPDKQLVEIAKALATDASVLILDEPTSALTEPQSARLHAILRQRVTAGASVIYISHRLGDVLTVCDRVSVLRDGQVRLTEDSDALSEQTLIQEMAGEQPDFGASRPLAEQPAPTHLSVRGLRTPDFPQPISFDCKRGEILGIAGLAGAGRTELLNAVFGLTRRLSGSVEIRVSGRRTTLRSPAQAIRCGVGLVPEDRAKDGVFRDESVAFNTTVAGLERIANRAGRLLRAREADAVRRLAQELRVRADGVDQTMSQLSGGNQQKLMLARWLHCDATLLRLDEPTRGVDVAAKQAIHGELFALRDRGVSMVVASSELDDLASLCDRVLVLSNRKPVAEFRRGDWRPEDVLRAAFSQFVADREQTAGDAARPKRRAELP